MRPHDPYADPPAAEPVPGPGGWLRTRIEEHIAAHGLAYPWWIPVVAILGQVGAVGIALSLRDALWPVQPVTAALVLVILPGIWMIGFNRHLAHTAETVAGLGAAALLLWNPVGPGTALDVAPALLALITAEVVARDGIRNGLVVSGISLAMIGAAAAGPGLDGTPVHLVDVPLGFVVGYMLLWQMRALTAERAAREGEYARATLAERERIAREIHDLVAHSLSVTLLQITGARHALGDIEGEDAAVADIDGALADAERVGRQAMVDIRQTVSTLADGPSETRALPSGSNIADLVAQLERAGLHVEYDEAGDPGRLAQATGLGLYRIAQESLANIAKHAPGSTARVRFSVTSREARLVVRNALPAKVVSDGAGSGLAGMSARAEQLGARLTTTAVDGDWLVDLVVPLRERNGLLSCPLRSAHRSGRLAW
ncbi:histidine kinase [Nocardioides marmoriginsengisoli]|uniref:histidine kinase n=1 Tax=Nocardioides marmoriginsengisoli TaxID=661483 RepID=A0A3N0CB18_9ACTN|nr:histidine kinase [Nocardioides marmoriginsengisoli]RNL60654.1 histidine kinase [Nocardioides marmoriginsengisoli]